MRPRYKGGNPLLVKVYSILRKIATISKKFSGDEATLNTRIKSGNSIPTSEKHTNLLGA